MYAHTNLSLYETFSSVFRLYISYVVLANCVSLSLFHLRTLRLSHFNFEWGRIFVVFVFILHTIQALLINEHTKYKVINLQLNRVTSKIKMLTIVFVLRRVRRLRCCCC